MSRAGGLARGDNGTGVAVRQARTSGRYWHQVALGMSAGTGPQSVSTQLSTQAAIWGFRLGTKTASDLRGAKGN